LCCFVLSFGVIEGIFFSSCNFQTVKGYSKSCWTPRLRVSHLGQDKHAWNEVQRHNRPADTGSLETRTLINLATMYSIYYQAIQKKKKTNTQRQEDRSYEEMCSKVLGQRNAGLQDSEGAARRVLICQTLGLES
jgi:hypothetical protein